MKFTKMHGCGNDYVYVNGMAEHIASDKKPAIVKALSDRHFGIGGDGVIFINASEEADFEMEMWNADGTRAEMCGNGIRCVAKYVYDKGLTDKTTVRIISAGTIKTIELTIEESEDAPNGGVVKMARVNMGRPILIPSEVPAVPEQGTLLTEVARKNGTETALVAAPIHVQGKAYAMTCVSMGNPHAIVFVEDTDHFPLETVGPDFEHHSCFPKRTNTEFVQVLDRTHVKMRVWERGTGETLACGTGSSATIVACVLNGLTEPKAEVELLGGTLLIEWDREEDTVYMTGPATIVFEGEIEI